MASRVSTSRFSSFAAPSRCAPMITAYSRNLYSRAVFRMSASIIMAGM